VSSDPQPDEAVSSRLSASPGLRRRNPRGEGSRLRAEIVDAAAAILEQTGNESAVTLRAIARAVGIAAPSIYAHFPDREAILDQVVADGFADFTASLRAAVAGITDPVERLYAMGRAYLSYAAEQPERYRILFQHPEIRRRQTGVEPAARAEGRAALEVLVEAIANCARAGRSASTDYYADAVANWVAMHGLAILLAETPESFPWPDQDQLFRALVDRIVQLNGQSTSSG
jgi:AcrR family transcriptional regulator